MYDPHLQKALSVVGKDPLDLTDRRNAKRRLNVRTGAVDAGTRPFARTSAPIATGARIAAELAATDRPRLSAQRADHDQLFHGSIVARPKSRRMVLTLVHVMG